MGPLKEIQKQRSFVALGPFTNAPDGSSAVSPRSAAYGFCEASAERGEYVRVSACDGRRERCLRLADKCFAQEWLEISGYGDQPLSDAWILVPVGLDGERNEAVVDGHGRVHGIDALRVVDASIMPDIITGNLNATTIMLAEKIADHIRGRTPLPRADAPYYVADGAPARGEPKRA